MWVGADRTGYPAAPVVPARSIAAVDDELGDSDRDFYPAKRWQQLVVLFLVMLLALPLVIGALTLLARAF